MSEAIELIDIGGDRPEGITEAADPFTYYVSELEVGGIKLVNTLTGSIEQLVPSFPPRTRGSTGLWFDKDTNLVLAAGGGPGFPSTTLSAYSAVDGAEVAVCVPPPEDFPRASLLNDVTVLNGKVYVTESFRTNQLYVLDLAELSQGNCVSSTLDLGDAFGGAGFGANGITPFAGGLLVARTTGGGIFSVDVTTNQVTQIIEGSMAPTPDGITVASDDILYISENALNKHDVFQLTASEGGGVVAEFLGEIASPLYDSPATCATSGSSLASVNARFSTVSPQATFQVISVDRFGFTDSMAPGPDMTGDDEGIMAGAILIGVIFAVLSAILGVRIR